MQRRYCDPGQPFSVEAFQALYGGTFSVGVYSGAEVTTSTLSSSQVVLAPGFFMVPTPVATGVLVEETDPVYINIGGTFPPAGPPRTYTVCSRYNPVSMGLLGGTSVIYYVTAGELTVQPDDGCILAWIRHPGGSLPLIDSYIVQAPRMRLWDLGLGSMNRVPVHIAAPDLVCSLGTNTTQVSGYNAVDMRSWRGFQTLSGLTPGVTRAYYHFPVRTAPYRFQLRSVIPTAMTVTCALYDTSNTLVTTATWGSHTTLDWDEALYPTTTTWTLGDTALVLLTFIVPDGTVFEIADLVVDFWPWPLSSVA